MEEKKCTVFCILTYTSYNSKECVKLLIMYILLQILNLFLAASELTENEFTFECPVTKDSNYTLTLSFSSTTVLKYDSKTSLEDISEQWRDKVTFHPENGNIKLSHLNQDQLGTYTCESTTAQYRYITQTKLPSRGNISTFLLKQTSA